MRNFSKIYLSYLLFTIVFAGGCASVPKKSSPELRTVSYVNKEHYLGKWYEIARYPNWFQENCYSATADYELGEDGLIKVVNRCREGEPEGKLREAVGIAKIVDKITNAKLKVTFFWPFYGDYWIIDLDDNYEYVVVSEPRRKYLWVLSRNPKMRRSRHAEVMKTLEEKYFDSSLLIYTQQNKNLSHE